MNQTPAQPSAKPFLVGYSHIFHQYFADIPGTETRPINGDAYYDIERLSATDWRYHIDLHVHFVEKLYIITRCSFALYCAQEGVFHPDTFEQMLAKTLAAMQEDLDSIVEAENIVISDAEKACLPQLAPGLVRTLTERAKHRPDPSSPIEVHAGNNETTLPWSGFYSFVIPTTFHIWRAVLYGDNSLDKFSIWRHMTRLVDLSMLQTLSDYCTDATGPSIDLSTRQLVTLTICAEGAAHCLLDSKILEAIRPELSAYDMGTDADVKDYLTAAGNFVRGIRKSYEDAGQAVPMLDMERDWIPAFA